MNKKSTKKQPKKAVKDVKIKSEIVIIDGEQRLKVTYPDGKVDYNSL